MAKIEVVDKKKISARHRIDVFMCMLSLLEFTFRIIQRCGKNCNRPGGTGVCPNLCGLCSLPTPGFHRQTLVIRYAKYEKNAQSIQCQQQENSDRKRKLVDGLHLGRITVGDYPHLKIAIHRNESTHLSPGVVQWGNRRKAMSKCEQKNVKRVANGFFVHHGGFTKTIV